MNAPDDLFLPDVQASADRRNIAIQRVGVRLRDAAEDLGSAALVGAGYPHIVALCADEVVGYASEQHHRHVCVSVY